MGILVPVGTVNIKEKNIELWMAGAEAGDMLAVRGKGPAYATFNGREESGVKYCNLSHENRLALNDCVVWTKPTALGAEGVTIGLGDRTGLFGAAQLFAVSQSTARPVLAQQSLRELSLTGRTYRDVIDSASFAVFKCGWTKGWGADGDHLKRFEDIEAALKAGCSMITLDCSEVLQKAPADAAALSETYGRLSEQTRERYRADYLVNENTRVPGIAFTEVSLMRSVLVYRDAIELAARVYNELILPLGRGIDFEISLDETNEETTYEGHLFVASELARLGIAITSLAPRFVGEFHKGVDYRGNVDEFAKNLDAHAEIAKAFGYKISIHSGSDKYSIFPLVAGITQNRFHLKTSGTSWLMAAKTIAECDPSLYRRMHRCALKHFEEARAYYYVHADPARVPDVDSLRDEALPALFDLDDGRQLIHITYGFMFSDPELKKSIFSALKANRSAANEAVGGNIMKHLAALRILNTK